MDATPTQGRAYNSAILGRWRSSGRMTANS